MANLSNISPPVRWDISNLKSQHIWHEIATDTWSRTSDAQHMEYDKCSETLHTFQVTRETHDDKDMLFSDNIHGTSYVSYGTRYRCDLLSHEVNKGFWTHYMNIKSGHFYTQAGPDMFAFLVSGHMVQRTLCIYSTNTYLCTHTCAQLLTAILRKWKDCFCSHSDAWPFPFTHSVEAQCKIVLSLFTKSKMYILTIFLPVNAPHYLPETHFNIS